MNYENIEFNPDIGLHCWGFVRHVYRDRAGIDLIQFPYSNSKQNGDLIDNVRSTLPQCEPRDLAVFVADSEAGDRVCGIVIEEDGELYAAFMTKPRSRVLSWKVCDRVFKPICYSVESMRR